MPDNCVSQDCPNYATVSVRVFESSSVDVSYVMCATHAQRMSTDYLKRGRTDGVSLTLTWIS